MKLSILLAFNVSLPLLFTTATATQYGREAQTSRQMRERKKKRGKTRKTNKSKPKSPKSPSSETLKLTITNESFNQ